jgi:hypothetical protein
VTVTEGLSYAIGRNLLDPSNTNPHWQLCADRLRVYLYNLEDDIDETMRRVMAVMNFHSVEPPEVDDFLWFGDGTIDRLLLAVSEAGRKLIRTPQADQLIQVLQERRIDVLILDPFVKLHTCSENDNGEMDFVMVVLKDIAIKANCAIWLVHHSGKTGTDVDQHGLRGASAIPSAGRISETISVPTKKERERYGLGRDIIKLETTKANMSALGDDVQWLRVRGHPVGNGDFAQVIELYAVKDATERMDEVLFDEIVVAIRQGPTEGKHWVFKREAKSWIGHAFTAGGIGNDDRANVLIEEWMKLALLIPVEDAKDDRGRPVKTAIQLNELMAAKYRAERWA